MCSMIMHRDHRVAGSTMAPLGITMGCPAGVGPEVIVKAFDQEVTWRERSFAVVLGDMEILKRARTRTCSTIDLSAWMPGMPLKKGTVNVYELTNLDPESVPFGVSSRLTGQASFTYVNAAIDMCLSGALSGMVTGPINKAGLRLAGIGFPGHTEILASRTGTQRFAMLLAGQRLKVVLVTIHCPLRDVPNLISVSKNLDIIELIHESLVSDFAIKSPRIAVCGLNPHAGEGGLFGDEESRIIEVAISRAREAGIDASGPYPPDTVFYFASMGRFDAVVCQYHDQGLIPFKLLHFKDGVNVTLGLPIIRTSVDHGTGYDIAGTGQADCASMVAAVRLADTMRRARSSCLDGS